MDKRERLCIFCTNFVWEQGGPWYSEMTPGYDAKIECEEFIWNVNLNLMSIEEFRETILTAGTCKHYHCVDWDKSK